MMRGGVYGIKPPITQRNIVKNLTKTFCKVADEEIEEKLSKRQKSKTSEGLAAVPTGKGKEAASKVSK